MPHLMMPDLGWQVLALLVLAGLVAGYVDAVVGGGGLVQLPSLLLALPTASPVEVLATNKLASALGVTVSATTYYRRIRPDPATFAPLMLAAFVGSAGGAAVASLIPREAFAPIILVVLVGVGGYVLARPRLGAETRMRWGRRGTVLAAVGVGLVVGAYDGALGPGTGSFFVLALVGLVGHDFLTASANARLANWATNIAALVVFVPQGAVLWGVGLLVGVANIVGSYLGAITAVRRGAGFVRVFFVVVVGGFVVRIGGEVIGLWG